MLRLPQLQHSHGENSPQLSARATPPSAFTWRKLIPAKCSGYPNFSVHMEKTHPSEVLGLPHLQHSHGENSPQLSARVTPTSVFTWGKLTPAKCSGYPNFSVHMENTHPSQELGLPQLQRSHGEYSPQLSAPVTPTSAFTWGKLTPAKCSGYPTFSVHVENTHPS